MVRRLYFFATKIIHIYLHRCGVCEGEEEISISKIAEVEKEYKPSE